MKQTIFKYPIPGKSRFTLELPYGATILDCQYQEGVGPCMWALVYPNNSPVERQFRMFGTGHDVEEEGLAYIGTFLMNGGAYVWHVFEKE